MGRTVIFAGICSRNAGFARDVLSSARGDAPIRASSRPGRDAGRVTIALWLAVAAASALTLAWWSGDDTFGGSLAFAVPAAWGVVLVVAAVRKLWRKVMSIAMVALAMNGAGLAGVGEAVRSAVDEEPPPPVELHVE